MSFDLPAGLQAVVAHAKEEISKAFALHAGPLFRRAA